MADTPRSSRNSIDSIDSKVSALSGTSTRGLDTLRKAFPYETGESSRGNRGRESSQDNKEGGSYRTRSPRITAPRFREEPDYDADHSSSENGGKNNNQEDIPWLMEAINDQSRNGSDSENSDTTTRRRDKRLEKRPFRRPENDDSAIGSSASDGEVDHPSDIDTHDSAVEVEAVNKYDYTNIHGYDPKPHEVREREAEEARKANIEELLSQNDVIGVLEKIDKLLVDYYLRRNWTKSLPPDRDKNIGAFMVSERIADQAWIKFLNKVRHLLREDLFERIMNINSMKLFRSAENSMLRHYYPAVERGLNLLREELRPGKPTYPEGLQPNVISKDGQLRILRINAGGTVTSTIDINHIESVNAGHIISEDGKNKVECLIYEINKEEHDPLRQAYINDVATDDKKKAREERYNEAQRNVELAVRRYELAKEAFKSIEMIYNEYNTEDESESNVEDESNIRGKGKAETPEEKAETFLKRLGETRETILEVAREKLEKEVSSSKLSKNAAAPDRMDLKTFLRNIETSSIAIAKVVSLIKTEKALSIASESKEKAIKLLDEFNSTQSKSTDLLKTRQGGALQEIKAEELASTETGAKDIEAMINSAAELEVEATRKIRQVKEELEARGIEYKEEDLTISNIKLYLKDVLDEFQKEIKTLKEETKEPLKEFSEMREGEEASLTRLVVKARVACSLERTALYQRSMAQSEYNEAKKEYGLSYRIEQSSDEDQDELGSGIKDGEDHRQEYDKRIKEKEIICNKKGESYMWCKGYAQRVLQELINKMQSVTLEDITDAEAKDKYLLNYNVYAKSSDATVEIYHHDHRDSFFNGIKLNIKDIDFKNSSGKGSAFTLRFRDSSEMKLSDYDDLDEFLRKASNDICTTSLQSAETQIHSLLEILKGKDSEIDESALKLKFANIHLKNQWLEEYIKYISAMPAPQNDETLITQQHEIERLMALSSHEMLGMLHKNISEALKHMDDLRQKELRVIKAQGSAAIGQNKREVAAQELSTVVRYGLPLRREGEIDTIGHEYAVLARAGELLGVDVFPDAPDGKISTLMEHLSNQLADSKVCSPAVRAKIMKQSIIEAYFRHASEPLDVRLLAMSEALHFYGVKPELAGKIASDLDDKMKASFTRWLNTCIDTDQAEGRYFVKDYLHISNHSQGMESSEYSEMVNRAAAAHFRSDLDQEEREEAMLKALKAFKPSFRDDDRLLDKLAGSLQEALGPRNDKDTVFDSLQGHKWAKDTCDKKAREIIKSAAEAREKFVMMDLDLFGDMAYNYTYNEITEDGEYKKEIMYDTVHSHAKDYAINPDMIVDKMSNYLDSLLHSAMDIDKGGETETDNAKGEITLLDFQKEKGIDPRQFAQMVKEACRTYWAHGDTYQSRKDIRQAISELEERPDPSPGSLRNAADSNNAISLSKEEKDALLECIIGEGGKLRNGLWSITDAMMRYIYCHDEINGVKKHRGDLCGGLIANEHVTSKSDMLEKWLASEKDTKYDVNDPFNMLWKNNMHLDAIYKKMVAGYPYEEALFDNLKPIELKMLGKLKNERVKELLTNAINFQNYWIESLKSAYNKHDHDYDHGHDHKDSMLSGTTRSDLETLVRHTWHQVLKMERDSQKVLHILKAKDQRPEKSKKALKKIVEPVGPPPKTMAEIDAKLDDLIIQTCQEVGDALHTYFESGEASDGVLLANSIAEVPARVATLMMEQRLRRYRRQGRHDDAFLASYKLAAEKKEFIEDIKKGLNDLVKMYEGMRMEELKIDLQLKLKRNEHEMRMELERLQQEHAIEKEKLHHKHSIEKAHVLGKYAKRHLIYLTLMVFAMNGNQAAMVMDESFTRLNVRLSAMLTPPTPRT